MVHIDWETNGNVFLALIFVLEGLFSSAVAAIWLLSKFGKLEGYLRLRLFPRQLISLALCDGIWMIPFTFLAFVDFSPVLLYKNDVTDSFCRVGFSLFSCFRLTGIFHEMHIAVAFAMQAFRFKLAMVPLIKSIPLLWVLGFLFGGMTYFTSPFTFETPESRVDNGTVVIQRRGCVQSYVQWGVDVVIVMFGFIVCAGAYIVVIVRTYVWAPPLPVWRDNFERASFYTLCYIVCYFPIILAYLSPALFESFWFFVFAVIVEAHVGLLNATVYAFQTRRGRKVLGDGGLDDPGARVALPPQSFENRIRATSGVCAIRRLGSYRVDIGGVDIVDIVSVHQDDFDAVAKGPARSPETQMGMREPLSMEVESPFHSLKSNS
uniref:G-protein coupled receptors family 1 profile domain-containing protein n=1 Tax=Noctiluca scintillans TaxID=2966 RepID=A0A7S1FGJ5_NOCSC|mmetsp:Transcript_59228/g.157661  ORF Transcript_59228/g.157661 Transcript_59228/m.157661 type:complete len:377 (+) Transcript_59228:27-1157(+)